VQARAQARRVRAGGLVAISGTARPAGSIHVLVERKGRSGRWSRVGTVRARVRRQRFRTNIRLRSAGLYRLTPWTGSIAAPALYVRAVRNAADVPPPSGGTAA
jgi:hypothetical protein